MTTREQAIEAAARELCKLVRCTRIDHGDVASAVSTAEWALALPPPPPSDAGERDRALVREGWDTHIVLVECCNRLSDAECNARIAAVNATHPPDAALAQMTDERDAYKRELHITTVAPEVERNFSTSEGAERDEWKKRAEEVGAVPTLRATLESMHNDALARTTAALIEVSEQRDEARRELDALRAENDGLRTQCEMLGGRYVRRELLDEERERCAKAVASAKHERVWTHEQQAHNEALDFAGQCSCHFARCGHDEAGEEIREMDLGPLISRVKSEASSATEKR